MRSRCTVEQLCRYWAGGGVRVRVRVRVGVRVGLSYVEATEEQVQP